METNYTQQEVLLMTGTTFTSSHWYERDEARKDADPSESERLEDACWNGFLQTMLPEICMSASDGKSLYLWQIRKGQSFLQLDLSEAPGTIESRFSIDPYLFLATQLHN
jgi:hypothetical protein